MKIIDAQDTDSLSTQRYTPTIFVRLPVYGCQRAMTEDANLNLIASAVAKLGRIAGRLQE